MTPVVNPWFFYWMDVADTLCFFAGLGAIIFSCVAVANLLCSVDYGSFLSKNMSRFVWAATLVCLLLVLFVPGKKTMTQMVVAQNVTYERVEATADTVKEVYEDILSLFEKEK